MISLTVYTDTEIMACKIMNLIICFVLVNGHSDSKNIQLAQWTFDASVSFLAYTVGQRGDSDFFVYTMYINISHFLIIKAFREILK